ncbi:hypothetical protein PG996_007695 [Apiospora saccharicola]|uniref:Uncharacterized protein n=1 Tax=Apiospora saccharicola TaxID=335842 RepID=A0ABR1VFB6_9PEZI
MLFRPSMASRAGQGGSAGAGANLEDPKLGLAVPQQRGVARRGQGDALIGEVLLGVASEQAAFEHGFEGLEFSLARSRRDLKGPDRRPRHLVDVLVGALWAGEKLRGFAFQQFWGRDAGLMDVPGRLLSFVTPQVAQDIQIGIDIRGLVDPPEIDVVARHK